MRQHIELLEQEMQRLALCNKDKIDEEMMTSIKIENFKHILEKKEEKEEENQKQISFYIERMNQLEKMIKDKVPKEVEVNKIEEDNQQTISFYTERLTQLEDLIKEKEINFRAIIENKDNTMTKQTNEHSEKIV